MLDNLPSYELFYSSGGHCGPYWTLEHAVSDARRKLNGLPESTTSISIVERDPLSVGGYGKQVMRIRRTDDDPQPNQKAY